MNELDISRMLLMFEQSVRQINKEEINPKIPELKLKDLHPVIQLVARARAKYLKELMNIANITESDQLPSPEQIKRLDDLHNTYQSLLNGSKAVEIAIDRGYLDVEID